MEFKKVFISELQPAEYNPRKDLQPGDPARITEYNLAEWMKFADYMEGATCITS